MGRHNAGLGSTIRIFLHNDTHKTCNKRQKSCHVFQVQVYALFVFIQHTNHPFTLFTRPEARFSSPPFPFFPSLFFRSFCTVNSFDGVWKSIYPLTDTHGWEEGLELNWKPYAFQVPHRLIPIPAGSLDSGTWFSLNKIVRRDESMMVWVGERREREGEDDDDGESGGEALSLCVHHWLKEKSDEFSNRITTGLIIMP